MDNSIELSQYEVADELVSCEFPRLRTGLTVSVVGASLAPSVLVRMEKVGSDAFYIVMNAFDLVSAAGSVSIPQFERDAYISAHDAYLGEPVGVKLVLGLDTGGRVECVRKAHCGVCSQLVTVQGHAARCLVGPDLASMRDMSARRRMAWLGDALHALDVRIAVSRFQKEDHKLQHDAQTYVSNESMASVYDLLVQRYDAKPEFVALGPSVRQRATAFEASYFGDFRRLYLQVEFSIPLEFFPDVGLLSHSFS